MGLYLVTGAAGFIGAAIAKKLLAEGHRVVTIDNLSTGVKSAIPEGCEFYLSDCQNPEVYKKIPQEKYDAIYHIAGQSSGEVSFDDPIYDLRTNTESTLLLLDFCMKNGCSRFMYASTMSVYGIQPDEAVSETEHTHPQSFYGVGKLASEHYLRIYQNYGIQSTSIRLFNVYGPGQNLDNMRQGMVSIYLSQMLRDSKIHVKGSASRYRDFVYIDDVVDAFTTLEGDKRSFNQIVNLSTGVRTTVGELIEKLIELYGQSVPVIYEGSTSGDVHGLYGSRETISAWLGKDATTLHHGLNRMLTWALGKDNG